MKKATHMRCGHQWDASEWPENCPGCGERMPGEVGLSTTLGDLARRAPDEGSITAQVFIEGGSPVGAVWTSAIDGEKPIGFAMEWPLWFTSVGATPGACSAIPLTEEMISAPVSWLPRPVGFTDDPYGHSFGLGCGRCGRSFTGGHYATNHHLAVACCSDKVCSRCHMKAVPYGGLCDACTMKRRLLEEDERASKAEVLTMEQWRARKHPEEPLHHWLADVYYFNEDDIDPELCPLDSEGRPYLWRCFWVQMRLPHDAMDVHEAVESAQGDHADNTIETLGHLIEGGALSEAEATVSVARKEVNRMLEDNQIGSFFPTHMQRVLIEKEDEDHE